MEMFIALCMGVLVYTLVYLAFHEKGRRADVVRRRLENIDSISQKEIAADEEMTKPLFDRFFRPMLKSVSDSFAKLMPRAFGGDASGAAASGLKKMLVQAGYSVGVTEYNAIRFFVVLIFGLLFTLPAVFLHAGPRGIVLSCLFGILAGYTVLRFSLTATITGRRKKIEQQLPDVLDLLSISVEAGLSFEQAINHIINSLEGPLIDEFTVTYREMTMGRSRKDALTQLGERCGDEDIRSFTGALVQAGQLGISLRNLLRSQADAIRQSRRARIQEKSMKISIKILFPMLLFIFPVIFIVVIGPAIVNVLKVIHS